MRLCANTSCRLHLIEPLGFHLDSRTLRRAGLDYGEVVAVSRYRSWAQWRQSHPVKRAIAFTTKANRMYCQFRFQAGDALVFGPETRGLPAAMIGDFVPGHRLKLPMVPQQRSLNLSNAVAIAIYEAWRQADFDGAG